MFHFESPDHSSYATPETNRGCELKQTEYDLRNRLIRGYEYFHESDVREVHRETWGDYAMLEILTPIPAQYNVYYAGWEPKDPLGGNASNVGNAPYITFHHPGGTIKKVARTFNLNYNSNPFNQGCNALTGVIDNVVSGISKFFGGKGKSNLSSLCNYTAIPWYSVHSWENGSTARASSGSALLNVRGKIMGELSFGPTDCLFSNGDTYGKFSIAYNNATIKQSINPGNEILVNNIGIGGRARNCYAGNMQVAGQYFPLNHYQSTNHLDINVQGNITNGTNEVYVHNGSDYTYNAGGSIILEPGFKTDLM